MKRNGITAIEVAVVILIIVMLSALLIPAVQQARLVAQRHQKTYDEMPKMKDDINISVQRLQGDTGYSGDWYLVKFKMDDKIYTFLQNQAVHCESMILLKEEVNEAGNP